MCYMNLSSVNEKWNKLRKNKKFLKALEITSIILLTGEMLIVMYIYVAILPLLSTLLFLSYIQELNLPSSLFIGTIILYISGGMFLYFSWKIGIKRLEGWKLLRENNSNIIKTLKKINGYIILSILLISSIIFVGTNIYQTYYKNDLPLSIESNSNDYNISISSKCVSENELLVFTEGDELECSAKLNNKSEYDFVLDKIIVYDNTYNKNEILWEKSNISINLKNGISDIGTGYFYIPITSQTTHHTTISLKFDCMLCPEDIKPNSYIIINSSKNYMPISRDDYDSNMYQRFAVLTLIFSIGIFSVISSVKNLKDIIEEKS